MILFGDKIVPWEAQEFLKILTIIQANTVIDYIRLNMLWQCAKQVITLDGDAAEVGVYRGGSARLLSEVLQGNLHLFDTFEGMPETNPNIDVHNEGDFAKTSIEKVKTFVEAGPGSVYIYQGIFPETVEDFDEDITFKFVHIDVDIYKSTKEGFEFFYDKMISGGIMVCDDYGFKTCPGAKKAVDEFFKDRDENPIYIPTGQAIIIKL